MEPNVHDYEEDREDGPLDVCLDDLMESEVMEHHRIGVALDRGMEVLVAKFDHVTDLHLESCD